MEGFWHILTSSFIRMNDQIFVSSANICILFHGCWHGGAGLASAHPGKKSGNFSRGLKTSWQLAHFARPADLNSVIEDFFLLNDCRLVGSNATLTMCRWAGSVTVWMCDTVNVMNLMVVNMVYYTVTHDNELMLPFYCSPGVCRPI